MKSDMRHNESTLVLSAQKGSQEALKQIYQSYVKYLTAVCSRYIINHEDVKDILQESFLKIFSAIGTFDYRGDGSLKMWLTKVVVNESLKFLNKAKHLNFSELDESATDIPDEEPHIDDIPSSTIFNLIRELPDGYRTIFNLYVIEGKSHREIASMLGINESTSASQLHRAKALLASKIHQLKLASELHAI